VLFLPLAPYLTWGMTHVEMVEMVLELEEMKNVMMMRRLRLGLVLLEVFLSVVSDGSPLVRVEVAAALSCVAFGHNKHLKSIAVAY
jgi:hypothetical protein